MLREKINKYASAVPSYSNSAAQRAAESAYRSVSAIKIKKSLESEGVIETVFVVNRTVYAIIRRATESYDETGHSFRALFNNTRNIPEDKLTAFELFIPISNIDLTNSLLKPEDLIGSLCIVSELNGRAIKASYVGALENLSQNPLDLINAALQNARALAGATSRIEENELSKQFLQENFNITDEQLELFKGDLKELKGKTMSVENDAVFHRTTAEVGENEIIIKDNSNILRGKNNLPMKTRNCHLPISIFTAR